MNETPLPADLRETLHRGLMSLALDADALTPRLLDYLALLVRWNRTYNLTAVRDPREMVTRHLLDSLAMHGHLHSGHLRSDALPADTLPAGAAQPSTLADLGTGPGLPGIPLAIATPQLQVTLVESNGKKARFLREAVRTLGLGNARVAESRAEALDEPAAYDALTARALDVLTGIIEVGGHLLKPGGRLLAMKGVRPDEEIAALPPGWTLEAVHPLTVPGLVGERHLVVVRRDRV